MQGFPTILGDVAVCEFQISKKGVCDMPPGLPVNLSRRSLRVSECKNA